MIKQVIAIASGKGGVGKSTIAVNIAYSLKAAGYSVGLLDADLYGPSLPLLLGIPNDTSVEHDNHKNMKPIVAYDMPTMSIGYLVDERAPAIWRGPMASKAIQQLFFNTQWGNLDYLIVDLPPGTGDIPLTLAQKLPLQSVIIVTTPQQVALADVRKAIAMFHKVNIPLLGIVENMSVYQCPQCAVTVPLFGSEGGKILSQDYQTTLLGCVPIDIQVQEQGDQGKPIVLVEPESASSTVYHRITIQIPNRVQTIGARTLPTAIAEK